MADDRRRARKKQRKSEAKAPAEAAAGWHTAWQRLPDRTQHLICIGLLLAVSFAFFAPVHFSGKTLIGGDTVQWKATAQAVLDYQEAYDEPALWTPNVFGGMPAFMISYATQIPQVGDVFRLLRKVLWPTSHFLVLLLGMYGLVVYLTRDKLSGLLAACAYGLTTYLPILLIAGHNSKYISLCYVPWLAWAFVYTLRRPRLLASLLFAAALAVNLRAGHVQITYYAAFLLGIWWLVEAVGAVQKQQLPAFGKATGWLAFGSVLSLLMVAQPYLVHAQYKAFTIRGAATGEVAGTAGLDWTYAMAWSQQWGELVTLLVASAYGGGGATFWGNKIFTAGPHYLGGIVLLLAIVALWRLRDRTVWAIGGGALLMILFAVGEYFPALNRFMFDYFPLFNAWRVPETWLSMVAFALALLAAYGLYAVTRDTSVAAGKATAAATDEATEAPAVAAGTSRSIYVTLGLMIGLVLVLYLGRDAFFAFEKPGEEAQIQRIFAQQAQQAGIAPDDPRVAQAVRSTLADTREERVHLFNRDVHRTLVFLVLAGLFLVAYRRGMIPAYVMQFALVLLVALDLGGVGRRYLNEDALVRSNTIDDQIPTYEFDRYLIQERERLGGSGHFRVLSFEGSPSQLGRPSYHHEALSGYSGAKLRLYQDFLDHMLFDPNGLPNENALDLMNTRYVVAQGTLPGMNVVYQDEQTGFLVLENPDAVPRAFFVGTTEVVDTPEATWERLQSPAFDPRSVAVLAEPLDAPVTPIDSTSQVSVELVEHTAREITWQVSTDAPRLLVVSEVYYPAGWTATLDGEAAEIVRANYLLRAVSVPAGEHTLRMRFDPPRHSLSLWLSGLSTLFVYGGILVLLGLAYRRT